MSDGRYSVTINPCVTRSGSSAVTTVHWNVILTRGVPSKPGLRCRPRRGSVYRRLAVVQPPLDGVVPTYRGADGARGLTNGLRRYASLSSPLIGRQWDSL